MKKGPWMRALPNIIKQIKSGGKAEKFAVKELRRLAQAMDRTLPEKGLEHIDI